MAENNLGNVLVVGAGVGGIKAAIELAERGCGVYLTEASPAIGGILSQLDYQFPNNHCGLCRMLPVWERDPASEYCMRKGLFHENIRIMPMTELTGVSGEAGQFEVTLKRRARGVDPRACTGCGRCVEVCPVEAPEGFNEGLSKRKAVYQEVPHNLPYSYVVDFEVCTRCGECVKACPTEAIDLTGEETEEVLEVGAVIMASGCGLYDPSPMETYNYGRWPEVVTSLEVERMLSGTGPSEGKLIRPSDGAPVKSVAWVQCVGSRNHRLGQDYCSSICCMFALKEAMLTKERYPDAKTSVFYMDLRAYGKEGYRYQKEAEEQGIELIRGRVSALDRGADGRISIKYAGEAGDGVRTEPYDLVVLATGQATTPELERLSLTAGVTLSEHGFAPAPGLSPEAGSRPGVYWCGSATGLKEISETVIQAQAAAMAAAGDAAGAGVEAGEAEAPARAPRDVSREEPRVGLLMCACYGHQKEDLPWEDLKEAVSRFPDLAEILDGDRLCREEGFEGAREGLKQKNFNRLIIGACRPYLYDRRLRKLAAALGIPDNLVEVVDLRGIGTSPNGPDEKKGLARSSIAASLFKLRGQEAFSPAPAPVDGDLLVIGGGLAGMEAALSAAGQGTKVWLVEKSGDLGGEALRRRYTLDGLDPAAMIDEFKKRVREEEAINVLLDTEVTGLGGEVGRFRAALRRGDEAWTVPCGAVIVASGGREAGTDEYGYGRSPRIMVQGDLEIKLGEGALQAGDLGKVVMIQCVGSRDERRSYCSRICCASALKNAARIREINPQAHVYVLYRDMMSYGFLESHYRKAREQGIQFITYGPDRKPEVRVEGEDVSVLFREPILDRTVEVKPDLVVLSTGVEPSDQRDMAGRLGLKLDRNGFFQEVDSKWRPVDLNRPGVFAAGLAVAPCNMAEALMQSRAAAMRAVNILSKDVLRPARAVSEVRQSICSVCETCIQVCPYEARYKEDDRIRVIASACQGCGICVAACPNGAAWLPAVSEKQTLGMLEGLLESVRFA